jgi:hypothetical protein
VKVIKPGRGPRKWIATCHKCHAVIEAEDCEMKNIVTDFREGGQFSREVCVECGDSDLIFYPKMRSEP